LVGILAVPSLIFRSVQTQKQVLDKITPYQGWIGIGALVWGIVRIGYFFHAFAFPRAG